MTGAAAKALVDSGRSVPVPEKFPDADHVKFYNEPVVSPPPTLQELQCQWWDMSFDPTVLWPLLLHKFNIWLPDLPDYLQLIVPIVLIKSLAQTLPSQEASNGYYEVQYIKKDGPVCSKISCKPTAIMPLNIDTMAKRHPEGYSKDGIRAPETVECSNILTCILRHGVPEAMANTKPTKKSADPR